MIAVKFFYKNKKKTVGVRTKDGLKDNPNNKSFDLSSIFGGEIKPRYNNNNFKSFKSKKRFFKSKKLRVFKIKTPRVRLTEPKYKAPLFGFSTILFRKKLGTRFLKFKNPSLASVGSRFVLRNLKSQRAICRLYALAVKAKKWSRVKRSDRRKGLVFLPKPKLNVSLRRRKGRLVKSLLALIKTKKTKAIKQTKKLGCLPRTVNQKKKQYPFGFLSKKRQFLTHPYKDEFDDLWWWFSSHRRTPKLRGGAFRPRRKFRPYKIYRFLKRFQRVFKDGKVCWVRKQGRFPFVKGKFKWCFYRSRVGRLRRYKAIVRFKRLRVRCRVRVRYRTKINVRYRVRYNLGGRVQFRIRRAVKTYIHHRLPTRVRCRKLFVSKHQVRARSINVRHLQKHYVRKGYPKRPLDCLLRNRGLRRRFIKLYRRFRKPFIKGRKRFLIKLLKLYEEALYEEALYTAPRPLLIRSFFKLFAFKRYFSKSILGFVNSPFGLPLTKRSFAKRTQLLRERSLKFLRKRIKKSNRSLHSFRYKWRSFFKRNFWLLYSVQNKRPRFYKKYLYGLWQTRVYPVPFQLKFRFLKRIFYSKKRKFNRRKWKTTVWAYRDRKNRKSLRKFIKYAKLGTLNTFFADFYTKHETYFIRTPTVDLLFSKTNKFTDRTNGKAVFFEFDSFKHSVLNRLFNYSLSPNIFASLKLRLHTFFPSIQLPKREFLLNTLNSEESAPRFLLFYSAYKQRSLLKSTKTNIKGARVRLKKSQLSLVRRRTNYHVLKRKILMKPKRKTWLKKVYWRHWIRRYAPGRFRLKLKFKSKLKSALIHKHLVALTGGLRMINRLATETFGMLHGIANSSARFSGLSFVRKWFYRAVGARMKYPRYYVRRVRGLKRKRRGAVQIKERRFTKISDKFKLSKSPIYSKKIAKSKKFSRTNKPSPVKVAISNKFQFANSKEKGKRWQQKQHYQPFRPKRHRKVRHTRLWYVRQNLNPFKLKTGKQYPSFLYRCYALRLFKRTLGTQRIIWSASVAKASFRKYKRRMYRRVISNLPFYEKPKFKPWSFKWWNHYNKNFRETSLVKQLEAAGVCVKVTLNNVLISIVNSAGDPYTIWTAGSAGFKGPTKKTTTALDALLEEVFAFTNRVGFALFNIVFASSPSSFLARRFLGSFTQPFISVDSISFCGNIPHNGVRLRRQKRR